MSESLPLPGVPARRGRPPLPPGQAKSGKKRTAEYRQRHGIKSFALDAAALAALAPALLAAAACPMLKKADRAAIASLSQKISGAV